MLRTNEHHSAMKEEMESRFSADLANLQNSFEQLRDDVAKLLSSAAHTAKSGVGSIKDHAAGAVSDLKERSSDSLDRVGKQISRNPLLSAGMAFGIGYILAKLFSRR